MKKLFNIKYILLIIFSLILFISFFTILYLKSKELLVVKMYLNNNQIETNIKIGNQTYSTFTDIEGIKPGIYTIELESNDNGYKESFFEIEVKSFSKTEVTINLEQLPDSEAIEKSEQEWLDYFDIETKKYEETKESINSQYPATKVLPYFGKNFIFNYDKSNDKVVYFVDSLPNKDDYDRNEVLKDIDKYLAANKLKKDFDIEWR